MKGTYLKGKNTLLEGVYIKNFIQRPAERKGLRYMGLVKRANISILLLLAVILIIDLKPKSIKMITL